MLMRQMETVGCKVTKNFGFQQYAGFLLLFRIIRQASSVFHEDLRNVVALFY